MYNIFGMIPKVLYQTWKTNNLTKDMIKIKNSWKENNPEFEFKLYDDRMCFEFIRDNFTKRILEAYKKIKYGALKADLWRVCILYINGGFFTDLDTLSLGSINDFINDKTEFITPIDLGGGPYLFNGFIGIIKEHPILKKCIDIIVNNVEKNINYEDNRNVSGPGVLGKATNFYLKNNKNKPFELYGYYELDNGNNIHFLEFSNPNEIIKDYETKVPLFQNKNGNTKIQEAYIKQCHISKTKFNWTDGNPYKEYY